MSEKWTKEQIETAKKYLVNGCDTQPCDKCCFYIDKDGKKIHQCFELRADLEKFLAQNEHDADEEKRPNPLNDTAKWIDMSGMTLTGQTPHDFWRYMFAGQAMQGLLADNHIDNTAKRCVSYADALLKQLEEKK
ncbi:Uncharacterised protein [uncultured archaeon]|nr:Uncharacterised protein [uncultured archaeon]